ncbi:hypothetical protein ACLKA6_001030 [Drosophila palustris]
MWCFERDFTKDRGTLQINLHHCKAASAALMLRLAGGGADIALIQEPWVVCGKVSGLGSPDYKLFVSNAQVSLELQPAPVRLLACYMAYDQEGPLPEDITQSLISDCELNRIGLIVGCDANAHHTQWGSSNINARGYLKRDNDTWTTSSEESLEALLTKHFPGCSQHDIRNQQNSSEVRLNPSPFSSHNINWAINSFKPFKSPGPDGIAPAHLQHAVSAEMATLSAIRLRDLNYWNDHLKGHSSILLRNNSIPTKTDYCMPIEHTKTPFHTLIPSREEWAIEPPGKPGPSTLMVLS